ncbi:uncharacterized protein A4U43_C10F12130 [Asparagus officinalis]|uniref:Uncharacterized protein n=1 Tax=Asparagus officinalis TaxID=4686 RepID=A0A5P1E5H4_ASPOF|nr:uncharacterized protein A4U43_C10F12130 [Asparagus officinalis]
MILAKIIQVHNAQRLIAVRALSSRSRRQRAHGMVTATVMGKGEVEIKATTSSWHGHCDGKVKIKATTSSRRGHCYDEVKIKATTSSRRGHYDG